MHSTTDLLCMHIAAVKEWLFFGRLCPLIGSRCTVHVHTGVGGSSWTAVHHSQAVRLPPFLLSREAPSIKEKENCSVATHHVIREQQ